MNSKSFPKTQVFKPGDKVRIISKGKNCIHPEGCTSPGHNCYIGKIARIGDSIKHYTSGLAVENLKDNSDIWCSAFTSENLELIDEEWDE
jgi:hypothetical protein